MSGPEVVVRYFAVSVAALRNGEKEEEEKEENEEEEEKEKDK